MNRHVSTIHHGFTLLELMITLALFSIIVGLSFGTFTFLHKITVQSEIDQLYATCMHAQRYAQVTNKPQTIVLTPANNSYSYNNTTRYLGSHVCFGTIPGAKGPPSSPAKELTKPITFKNQCITFSPHGIIESGTVYLTSRSKSVLYALSSPIAQCSYMRRYQYNGTWQLITEH